jgi:glutathione S-transferase
MITLYHCANARSFRVLWTLEELSVPYTLNMLPFPPRVLAREYLKINPLGTVPAFFDGETRMTESVAICQFLVTRYGPTSLALAATEPDFAAYLNWLYFAEAGLTVPQALVVRYARVEPEERRIPQVVDDYSRWFRHVMGTVDAAVASRPYLCADRFTIADIVVGYAILLARELRLDDKFSAAIHDYYERLNAREGFQRAVAAQGKPAP